MAVDRNPEPLSSAARAGRPLSGELRAFSNEGRHQSEIRQRMRSIELPQSEHPGLPHRASRWAAGPEDGFGAEMPTSMSLSPLFARLPPEFMAPTSRRRP